MRSKPLATRLRTLAARLALGLLVVGFAGARAGAAEVVAAGAGASAHGCKCGDACRGDSCCCSHGSTRAKSPAKTKATPAARPASSGRPASSPCVQAAPCGDAGTPINPSAEPIGRAALPPGIEQVAPRRATWVLEMGSRLEGPACHAGRLDEPPEAGGVA